MSPGPTVKIICSKESEPYTQNLNSDSYKPVKSGSGFSSHWFCSTGQFSRKTLGFPDRKAGLGRERTERGKMGARLPVPWQDTG